MDKVVFFQDGVSVGTDAASPFTFDLPVTSELDGPHRYTATAYDITGNDATSETASSASSTC